MPGDSCFAKKKNGGEYTCVRFIILFYFFSPLAQRRKSLQSPSGMRNASKIERDDVTQHEGQGKASVPIRVTHKKNRSKQSWWEGFERAVTLIRKSPWLHSKTTPQSTQEQSWPATCALSASIGSPRGIEEQEPANHMAGGP
jgi:hypothetical protein